MNNEQINNSNLEPENGPKKQTSKYLYGGLLIAVIIIIVILGIKHKTNSNSEGSDGNKVVSEQLVNLSAEERKLVESQLAGYQEQVKSLDGDALKKDREAVYYKIAGAQYKLGKYQNAIDTLDRISSEGRAQSRVWGLYANIYQDMGNKDKAKEAAKEALALDKENPDLWLQVIELSEGVSNDDIKKMYEDAINRTDQNAEVITSYAKFLEKIGDKPGAILMWQKAGQVDSKDKAQYDAEISRLQK